MNTFTTRNQLVRLALCALIPLSANAKVSEQEAERLKGDLTPFGAIRAGDDALGIPAWTGGISKPPADFKGDGNFAVDPYKDQAPKEVITTSNLESHKQYVSPGVQALLKSYPDTFKLPIYPTERSFAAPQDIYDHTFENAKSAELITGGNGFAHAYSGIPFPIPQSGVEAIWNHIVRFQGRYLNESTTTAQVFANGNKSTSREQSQVAYNYYTPGKDTDSLENIIFYYMNRVLPPSREAGTIYLVHETLDQVAQPRMAWSYLPGTRRVRRAPTVAYDTPVDGYVSDEVDLYNGAPNRFDWKIVGREPMYIPYNNYKIGQPGTKYDSLLTKGHVNPDYTRWELHRVWVVEATLKSGQRHVYGKRRFYLDEDSWTAVIAENYDNRGELWRVNLALPRQAYEVPATTNEAIIYHDLITRDYTAVGLRSEEKQPRVFNLPAPDINYWKPANLRRIGTN